jgi:hypothetical protein
MTIERDSRNGPFVICCDVCSETYECLGEDFSSAIFDAIGEGWFSIKRGSEFKHYCSQPCAKEDD